MAQKSKYFVVNVAFIIILVLSLVFSYNLTVLAQESSTATPVTLETATPSVVSSDGLSTVIPVTVTSTQNSTQTSLPWEESPTAEISSTPAFDVSPLSGQAPAITGRFSIIWGDSRGPTDVIPKTRYILTQDSGVSINLVLNDPIAGLEGGILSLNRKYVTVTGIWADVSAQGGNPDFHVTGISVEPSQKKGIEAAEVKRNNTVHLHFMQVQR